MEAGNSDSPSSDTRGGRDSGKELSRRKFLKEGGAALGGAALLGGVTVLGLSQVDASSKPDAIGRETGMNPEVNTYEFCELHKNGNQSAVGVFESGEGRDCFYYDKQSDKTVLSMSYLDANGAYSGEHVFSNIKLDVRNPNVSMAKMADGQYLALVNAAGDSPKIQVVRIDPSDWTAQVLYEHNTSDPKYGMTATYQEGGKTYYAVRGTGTDGKIEVWEMAANEPVLKVTILKGSSQSITGLTREKDASSGKFYWIAASQADPEGENPGTTVIISSVREDENALTQKQTGILGAKVNCTPDVINFDSSDSNKKGVLFAFVDGDGYLRYGIRDTASGVLIGNETIQIQSQVRVNTYPNKAETVRLYYDPEAEHKHRIRWVDTTGNIWDIGINSWGGVVYPPELIGHESADQTTDGTDYPDHKIVCGSNGDVLANRDAHWDNLPEKTNIRLYRRAVLPPTPEPTATLPATATNVPPTAEPTATNVPPTLEPTKTSTPSVPPLETPLPPRAYIPSLMRQYPELAGKITEEEAMLLSIKERFGVNEEKAKEILADYQEKEAQEEEAKKIIEKVKKDGGFGVKKIEMRKIKDSEGEIIYEDVSGE